MLQLYISLHLQTKYFISLQRLHLMCHYCSQGLADIINFLIIGFIVFVGENYVKDMWTFICPELMVAIEREPEEAVVPEMMDSFSKCIETLGPGCMSPEQLIHLSKILKEKLELHMEKQKERQDKRQDEDYDDEVEENLQDEHETDEYILSKVRADLAKYAQKHFLVVSGYGWSMLG